METCFVQFESDAEIEIISAFNCAQDPDVWKNQGQVSADDARLLVFFGKIQLIEV